MPIATANELREATAFHRERTSAKTRAELLTDWIERFPKVADKAIKDAVRLGLLSCSVPMPYQPTENDRMSWARSLRWDDKRLDQWVREQLPGCTVAYTEESQPGIVGGWMALEVSWAP